ncbi:MAG: carbamoyl phosphate synthase large subunit, partial [Lachnospiraceae bacterium]|nr:carbamoyl phosphate synthase large subunit [Lachnospiraceae bacterium]
GEAFYKAQEATQTCLPLEGTALVSVNDNDKPELLDIIKILADSGFNFVATGRTYELIKNAGYDVKKVAKMYEGRPDVSDYIINREVQLVINTPIGKKGSQDDSYIRKAAIRAKVPYITTMAAAKATALGIKAVKNGEISEVKSLQELHASIR